MSCGFILLNKPQGLSSQQAIYATRKKLSLPKSVKIGHGGTLDPLATGMLVVALGSATKFLEYLLSANKTYSVTAKLGQVTTTLDSEGEVLSESEIPALDIPKVQTAFEQFTGLIEQVPPMYSALKFQGKPLYHYARKGQEIARPPRQVHIYDLVLTALDTDKLSFISQVSKGTYIRSLVHDIGQWFGCGAHVQVLHRLQVDPFQAEQMVSINELNAEHISPIESIFNHLAVLTVSDVEIKKLKSGQKLNEIQLPILKTLNLSEKNKLLRLYNQADEQFVGLVKRTEDGLIIGEKWV